MIPKAASYHIPSGRHRLNTESVPALILKKMRARDDLRSRDPTLPALQQMNNEITKTTNEHRRQTWRQFMETLDQTVESSQGDRRNITPRANNEAITFDDPQVSSIKQISDYFIRQFTTSKLGRHTSERSD